MTKEQKEITKKENDIDWDYIMIYVAMSAFVLSWVVAMLIL